MQGYGKKHKFLPILYKKPGVVQERRRQHKLIMQLNAINEVMKTDHLKIIEGYIFTEAIKNRLASDILQALNKNNSLISQGFKIKRQNRQLSNYITTNLTQKPLSFQQKLKDLSMKKIQIYQIQAIDKLMGKINRKWKVQRNTNQTKLTKNSDKLIKQLNDIESINSNNPSKISYFSKQKSGKQTNKVHSYTQNSQVTISQSIGIEEVEAMIRKQKDILAVWLPPVSYPQFFGVFTLGIIKTSERMRCRLKKYLFYRHSISKRFFNAIIKFVSQRYNLNVQILQIIIDKSEYKKYLQPCGWLMKSWEGISKIMAVFENTTNF